MAEARPPPSAGAHTLARAPPVPLEVHTSCQPAGLTSRAWLGLGLAVGVAARVRGRDTARVGVRVGVRVRVRVGVRVRVRARARARPGRV